MQRFLFCDNTVLCNFAAIDRIDLLKTFLAGKGHWVQAVRIEAASSARYFACMAELVDLDQSILPAPVVLTEAESAKAEAIRTREFGGTAAEPLQHRGEAHTMFVIRNHPEFTSSGWLTDDGAAYDYAATTGIGVHDTVEIFATLVANFDCTEAEAERLMVEMEDLGRILRGR